MALRLTRVPASAAGLAGVADLRRRLAGRPRDGTQTIEQRRAAIVQATSASADIAVAHETLNGVRVERHGSLDPDGRGALIFAHGGAYVIGSAATHRGLAAALAVAAELPLLSVDYRLAPEHPFPAGRDDVVAVYAALVGQNIAPIALVGDSAGGGLMMQAALEIGRRGLPAPVAIAVTSPWVDLSCGGGSYRERAADEMILDPDGLALDSRRYRGERSVLDPQVSPVHADLTVTSPVLIQVGEHEVLHDDAHLLADRLSVSGAMVELEVWEGMVHAWHAFRSAIPEADAAMARIGQFLRAHAVAGAAVRAG